MMIHAKKLLNHTKKICAFVAAVALGVNCLALSGPNVLLVGDAWVKSITKYDVEIPHAILEQVKVDNPGIGSSLTFKHTEANGDLYFYALSDRGPNLWAPCSTSGQAIIIFTQPDFQPFISLVKVTAQAAVVEEVIIIDSHVLPPTSNGLADVTELPLTLNLESLSAQSAGLDSEAIDFRNNEFWVADEYGPSLVKIGPTGKILHRITFENGLPDILKARMENQGIEAMAITPSGKLLFAMESVLNVDGKTKDCAAFIRFMELDPETLSTRTFAYAFDRHTYPDTTKLRIADIAIIDETHWLVIEQGSSGTGRVLNTVQLIDSAGATDITEVTCVDGRALEYAGVDALKEIRSLKKTFLFDLRDYGWTHKKAEGLAYVDPTHIAIINDNDFGVETLFLGNGKASVDDYKINVENQCLLHAGKPSQTTLACGQNGVGTELWVIELQKPLVQ